MKGSEISLLNYMNNQAVFIIPVYQRKYSWKVDNCKQLYDDLKKVVTENHGSHFFGSVVSSVSGNGAMTEHHIIDGQQRLTTVTLLLLAIRNLVRQNKIVSQTRDLPANIDALIKSQWIKTENGIKLQPVKEDRDALYKLFGDEEDFDRSSKMYINYKFFCEKLLGGELSADQLIDALWKLQIISITLDKDDNAQLIFESLNSTGLALTEGDKIRNFILMNLSSDEQDRLFKSYWVKIESCTRGDVSSFVRDYLSTKQGVTPTINAVYREFKSYAKRGKLPTEKLLEDMLRYARIFEKLLKGETGLNDKAGRRINECLKRLSHLDMTVTRPFFMEVLRRNQDGEIDDEGVLKVFNVTENYIFRRIICQVPTNALSKLFTSIDREILRYDGTTDQYVDKFIFALLSKRESVRFPDDDEFSGALSTKPVYQMRSKNKDYIFERLENYGTVETKDVYEHLGNRDYSIEHIMPQQLSGAWKDSLGADAEKIHKVWLHRLANLTLTGYNPKLSNKSFAEKRDAEEYGYKASGLRMNQRIAAKERWGLPELEERNACLISLALKIWPMPTTQFKPAVRQLDSCSLADEDASLTGREIERFSYRDMMEPVASWADMMEHVVRMFYKKDSSILLEIAAGKNDKFPYFNRSSAGLRNPLKIDEQVYLEKNSSTDAKAIILRRLFAAYGEDPSDLVFFLKDMKK